MRTAESCKTENETQWEDAEKHQTKNDEQNEGKYKNRTRNILNEEEESMK